MLALSKILRSTPPENMNKSSGVRISKLKVGVSKATGNNKAVCTSTSTGVEHYTTSVEFQGAGSKAEVLVTCSCPDHKYRWEVALTRAGGSKILYSNGERPVQTNPSMLPGCCGHVFKLITELQSKKKM